jgi:hypothetical protein
VDATDVVSVRLWQTTDWFNDGRTGDVCLVCRVRCGDLVVTHEATGSGGLGQLLLSLRSGDCPVGVVGDRLQEYPEEAVGLSPEVAAAVGQWLSAAGAVQGSCGIGWIG